MNMLEKIIKFIFENEFMLVLAYLGMFGLFCAVICIIDSITNCKK